MRTILDHEIVKIQHDGTRHRVFIRLSRGGWLEHEPLPGDLRGLVTAMTLATDCLAGKFFPAGVVALPAAEKPALKALRGPGEVIGSTWNDSYD